MSTPVAVTKTPAEKSAMQKRVDAHVAEMKARNKMVVAIRGTQWGQGISEDVRSAVAHYCQANGLDAVRHVEVLGGRIYLTAEFYRERGLKLLLSGDVKPDEALLIHKDARLETLEKGANAEQAAWAASENFKRTQLRIEHGVPDEATGAALVRFHLRSGATIIGVNWCGIRSNDPVGKAEPVKTAITRAERRAWRHLAEVLPSYGEVVRPAEANAKILNAEPLGVVRTVAPGEAPKQLGAGEAELPLGVSESDGEPATRAEDEPQVATQTAPAVDQAARSKALARYTKLSKKADRTDAENDELAGLQEEYADFRPE